MIIAAADADMTLLLIAAVIFAMPLRFSAVFADIAFRR